MFLMPQQGLRVCHKGPVLTMEVKHLTGCALIRYDNIMILEVLDHG